MNNKSKSKMSETKINYKILTKIQHISIIPDHHRKLPSHRPLRMLLGKE